MSRSSKNKNKVPKITEAQYAEYISSLKGVSTATSTPPAQPTRSVGSPTTQTNGCVEMGNDNKIQ